MSNTIDHTTLFHLSEVLAQLNDLYEVSSTTLSGIVSVIDGQGESHPFTVSFKDGVHRIVT